MLDVPQGLVRRFERSVFDLERIIVAFEVLQGLQTGANRSDLLFQPRAARKKRRDDLVEARLKLARAVRAEAKKIGKDRGDDYQRDDARAIHRIADFRLRISDFRNGARNLKSTICNLKWLPPIAIG